MNGRNGKVGRRKSLIRLGNAAKNGRGMRPTNFLKKLVKRNEDDNENGGDLKMDRIGRMFRPNLEIGMKNYYQD